MALLWADGFDHYGNTTTGAANMILGPYAQVNNQQPRTTNPRNGTYSLYCPANSYIRRVFGAAKSDVGVGMAFYLTNLPTGASTVSLLQLADTNNIAQVSLVVGTTGTIELRRGVVNGTVLETSAVVIRAGEWIHLEVEWISNVSADSADGSVEIRVNETVVITYTGDVVSTASTLLECSQVRLMVVENSLATGAPHYLDDIYAWDTATDANNTIATFVGDKDVLMYAPDADGATSDWVRESDSPSASDFSKVNEVVQDGDTTYLEATTVNDVELLGIETVPATVDGIVAAITINMMRKTEAGASAVTPAIIGGSGGVGAGSAHTLTEEYAYYHDVVELDPDTTAAWTAATLSASSLRLTRTT